MLGRLLQEGPDSSEALSPLGCAYLTTFVAEGLMGERIEASIRLMEAYELMGQFALAAECLYEVLAITGDEAGSVSGAHLALLISLAGPDSMPAGFLDPIYAELRPALVEQGGALAAMAQVIDVRLGHQELDYLALSDAAKACLENGDHLAASAHRALAEAALRDDAPNLAVKHITAALALIGPEQAWLHAPFDAVAARSQMALGDREKAIAFAVRGWSRTLPMALRCKDDFIRQHIVLLGRECVDLAVQSACEKRDWTLLTEFIENNRIQAAPRVIDGTPAAHIGSPGWLVDEALSWLARGTTAGKQAMFSGDRQSYLSRPVVATRGGSRVLADAVNQAAGPESARLTNADAFQGWQGNLAAGAIAWSATVKAGRLYWALSDHRGAFDGGSLDLGASGVEAYLAELRSLVSQDTAADVASRPPVDVLSGLAHAGSFEEREVTGTLARLIPDYLKVTALGRPAADPLPVLFSLPAELSVVPWAVLPLDPGSPRPVRLVERVELTFPAPVAVQLAAPAPPSPTAPWFVAVTVANPDGQLRPADPVPAQTMLDEAPVTMDAFVRLLESRRLPDEAVLFVRSHLGQSSGSHYIAEKGILFSDDVLTARLLSLRLPDGEPALPMPGRVVLALCSGAGTQDTAGLTLGLAAACRLSGAREVLTSNYDVIDSDWSTTFDHRLAAAAVQPIRLAATLRALQVECLREWQDAEDPGRPPDQGPTPLVWASFGVVI